MGYIIISDIKELATIGIAGARPVEGTLALVTTASAPPIEIILELGDSVPLGSLLNVLHPDYSL